MIAALLTVAGVAVAGSLAAVKGSGRSVHIESEPEHQHRKPDFWHLSRQIQAAAFVEGQLRTAERLLTDIELSHQRQDMLCLSLHWTGIDGTVNDYDMLLDAESGRLAESLVGYERGRLQSTLLDIMNGCELPDAVTESVTGRKCGNA